MLDPAELIDLSGEAIDLATELAADLAPDADGKRRVNKAEGRAILQKILKLGGHLVRDLAD